MTTVFMGLNLMRFSSVKSVTICSKQLKFPADCARIANSKAEEKLKSVLPPIWHPTLEQEYHLLRSSTYISNKKGLIIEPWRIPLDM